MDIEKVKNANELIREVEGLEKIIKIMKQASRSTLYANKKIETFLHTSYSSEMFELSEKVKNKVVSALNVTY